MFFLSSSFPFYAFDSKYRNFQLQTNLLPCFVKTVFYTSGKLTFTEDFSHYTVPQGLAWERDGLLRTFRLENDDFQFKNQGCFCLVGRTIFLEHCRLH